MNGWGRLWRSTAGILVLLTSTQCGARSGLNAPCLSPVVPVQPEIMFVLDRSGSMGQRASDGRTYWESLDRAFHQIVPRLEGAARVGIAVFPFGPGPDSIACHASAESALEPTADINQVLQVFRDEGRVGGGTPTYEGMFAASSTQRRRRQLDPSRPRFIVLVTDGAASCNDVHSLDSCICLSRGSPDDCRLNPERGRGVCLDIERMLELVRGLRSESIDTYVLGMTGSTLDPLRLRVIYEQYLADVAQAGGRARSGNRPYLSGSNAEEIEQSLARPLMEQSYCHLVRTASQPIANDTLRAEFGTIQRDPSRRDGWDWDDSSQQRLSLFGPACDRAVEHRVLRWDFALRDRFCPVPH